MNKLTNNELEMIAGGSASVTLATVIVIGTASLLSVAAYKLFYAVKGKLNLPGGFGIEWQTR